MKNLFILLVFVLTLQATAQKTGLKPNLPTGYTQKVLHTSVTHANENGKKISDSICIQWHTEVLQDTKDALIVRWKSNQYHRDFFTDKVTKQMEDQALEMVLKQCPLDYKIDKASGDVSLNNEEQVDSFSNAIGRFLAEQSKSTTGTEEDRNNVASLLVDRAIEKNITKYVSVFYSLYFREHDLGKKSLAELNDKEAKKLGAQGEGGQHVYLKGNDLIMETEIVMDMGKFMKQLMESMDKKSSKQKGPAKDPVSIVKMNSVVNGDTQGQKAYYMRMDGDVKIDIDNKKESAVFFVEMKEL